MVVLKGICLGLAIFTSLLYLNNIIADLSSLHWWNSTLHSPEEIKNKDNTAMKFAKYRLILLFIMSVMWTLFVIF